MRNYNSVALISSYCFHHSKLILLLTTVSFSYCSYQKDEQAKSANLLTSPLPLSINVSLSLQRAKGEKDRSR